MTKNICFVVNSVGETSVPATIAAALEDHDDLNVDILAWFSEDSFHGDELVDVHCLEAPSTATGLNHITYKKAKEIISGYDLVQVHHCHSGTYGKILAYLENIPIVSREGNTRNGFTRKGRFANGITNILADRIVCNSSPVYDSFMQWERSIINDENVTIIPNGVDMSKIEQAMRSDTDLSSKYGVSSDAVFVGIASSFTDQKAYDILIPAIKTANDQINQPLHLVAAGDGPLRKEMQQLAKDEGIIDNIHFCGRIERQGVYNLLAQIDIYAMPSRWEGFSNAAVEALAAGNPCIFSNIDPFSVPYEDVAMFHPVDDVECLADHLSRLASNPAERTKYGKRGQELVKENYTLDRVSEMYYDLYNELT